MKREANLHPQRNGITCDESVAGGDTGGENAGLAEKTGLVGSGGENGRVVAEKNLECECEETE